MKTTARIQVFHCHAYFERPPYIDILVHPVTRSHVLDHTVRALWLGTPRPLDRAVLEAAQARA